VERFAELLALVYRELGFSDYKVALSTRPVERAGSDELWDWAEATLAEAAGRCGLVYGIQPGEGAFYGPKLEFALRDRQGRFWQCGTIQLDCVLPVRLGASYVGPDGSPEVPLMIHHAIFGSMGRAIAMLLEHHGGALPFWLAPEQVAVAPVSRDLADYAGELMDCLDAAGVRSVLYDGRETLARRIVAAREAQVPIVAVLGRREAEARSVTLRERDGAQSSIPLDQVGQVLAARR
jgi:threonyl-tRNA synthetase